MIKIPLIIVGACLLFCLLKPFFGVIGEFIAECAAIVIHKLFGKK